MRHRVAHRKLGRVTEHRISMLRNQATALLRHEHLTTTVPKAKELRPFVERIITVAKRGLANGGARRGGTSSEVRVLTARRLVMQDVQDREVVTKLFDAIAPRFASRAGGYTRLLRIGFRKGDSAEMAQVELVGSEFDPKAKTEAETAGSAKPKAKGVGGRLRAAAERLRSKKDDKEESPKASPKPSKGVNRKSTTPRKAGGS
jgi:large subunit ribosomal protein L17